MRPLLLTTLLFVLRLSVCAGTVAYWEFDRLNGGETPAAVGGEAFTLRSAGAGGDFETAKAPAMQRLPNPDRTRGFAGDTVGNPGALACPGNPEANRYLTTGPGTNVLRLHKTTWTVEGWVRFTGDTPDGYGDIILTTRDAPNFCGFNLVALRTRTHGEPLRLSCYFELKALGDVPASRFGLVTSPALHQDRWHHIALTWDATGEGAPRTSIYVDGMRAAAAEAPVGFDTESVDARTIDSLHIGAREASSKNSFAGEIDEFRISDKVLQPREFLMFPATPRPLVPACQVAKARKLSPNAPKANDVLMRALRWRPRNKKDPRSVVRAMDDFHVTGLVWAYIHDPKHIAEVTKSGRFFQGAVTASLQTVRSLLGESTANDAPDVPDFIDRYTTKNLDGTPNEQPWKTYWKNDLARVSGCCSNPEFEKVYVKALMTYIRAGATQIQRDEGGGNSQRPNYGGCFCPWCIKGFRAYLKERLTAEQLKAFGIENIDTFDYAARLRQANAPVGVAFRNWRGDELKPHFVAFQAHVSKTFHQRTRKALDEQAGFPVAMSCNNGVHIFDEVMQQFDWFFGELSCRHATPGTLYHLLKQAEKVDCLQIVTMPKKGGHVVFTDPKQWERQTRQAIAMSYAAGGICMVPWDVYMPDTFDEKKQRSMTARYFGTPEQYADIFGFLRANAAYLEGYEDAAAIGPGLLETRWGLQPPLGIAGDPELYAVVRAKPGQTDAPVVIHLVDWRAKPQAADLTFLDGAFFKGRALSVSLLVPAPFDAAAHRAAETTKDYAPLSRRISLVVSSDEEGTTNIQVPPLTPWGILVVEPAP